MSACSLPTYTTVGEISARFNVTQYRVRYAIQSRKIQPVQSAAGYRLFDEAAVKAIGEALEVTGKAPACGRRTVNA
jgi:DNA-binding transcriptional MerR regulator